MKKLTIEYVRNGTRVDVHVAIDNVCFDDDCHNFMNEAYAEGLMTDAFHEATSNRYKDPSPPIKLASKLKKLKVANG